MIAPPDGSVLAVARRPGDWLVRWQPSKRTSAAMALDRASTRAFNGHVFTSPGASAHTTETDLETGASLVGVRDAQSLEKSTNGPPMAWMRTNSSGILPEGNTPASLTRFNGGVPTSADTGRSKRQTCTPWTHPWCGCKATAARC